MKSLTLDEIKKSELETLKIFRDFCERNHLKYYLSFGTLLGAVRHKGFIPWDDDIDVIMPREDYNYLVKHFNEKTVNDRKLVSKETCADFYLDLAKIIDDNTVVIEEGKSLKIGVWIDVFPMDNIVDSRCIYAKLNLPVRILSLLLRIALLNPTKINKHFRHSVMHLIKFIFPSEAVDRMRKKRREYIGHIVTEEKSNTYGLTFKNFGFYGIPRAPRKFFEPSITLEFEGEQFAAPIKYNTILQYCYGRNYMILPPEKKRVSQHRYVCYYKES